MRSFIGRFLSAISLLVILIAALTETSLRALGFGHPLLYRASASGYEVVPDQTVSRLFKVIKYNSDGLRNDPIAAAPSKDVERILCLGDSITYGGSQIDNSETYTQQLQRILPGTEVLNAAASGWSLINELRWLRSHGTFGSSTIVLEIGENDLFQPFADRSILDQIPTFPSKPPKFALAEVVTRYLLPILGLGLPAEDPGAGRNPTDPAVASDALDAVAQIHDYATPRGATLMILYIDPDGASDDPGVVAARDRLFGWAQQAAVRLLRPELEKRQSRGRPLFFDGVHPNERGNEIIARELAHALSPHIDQVRLSRGGSG